MKTAVNAVQSACNRSRHTVMQVSKHMRSIEHSNVTHLKETATLVATRQSWAVSYAFVVFTCSRGLTTVASSLQCTRYRLQYLSSHRRTDTHWVTDGEDWFSGDGSINADGWRVVAGSLAKSNPPPIFNIIPSMTNKCDNPQTPPTVKCLW